MFLRTTIILMVIMLWAGTALSLTTYQPKPKPKDAISGEWNAVLTTPDTNLQLMLKLKLNGDKVTGSSESSHLGEGMVKDGTWAKNKLRFGLETTHAKLTLSGVLQNGKLTGEWDAGHMRGKWEAEKR